MLSEDVQLICWSCVYNDFKRNAPTGTFSDYNYITTYSKWLQRELGI